MCIFMMDAGVGASVVCYRDTFAKGLHDGLTQTIATYDPQKANFDFAQSKVWFLLKLILNKLQLKIVLIIITEYLNMFLCLPCCVRDKAWSWFDSWHYILTAVLHRTMRENAVNIKKNWNLIKNFVNKTAFIIKHNILFIWFLRKKSLWF